MAARRDLFHDAVRNALLKDGWDITDDPLHLSVGEVDLYVDIGAEKMFAAEKEERKIAVEIKSFTSPSLVADFHLAVGQFLNYRLALEDQMPERVLFLAISLDVYESFFTRKLAQRAIERYEIRLLVFDSVDEEIVRWIS